MPGRAQAVKPRPRHQPMRPGAASTRSPRCVLVQLQSSLYEHLKHDLPWTDGLCQAAESSASVYLTPDMLSSESHSHSHSHLDTPPGHQSTRDMGDFESLGPLLAIKLTSWWESVAYDSGVNGLVSGLYTPYSNTSYR